MTRLTKSHPLFSQSYSERRQSISSTLSPIENSLEIIENIATSLTDREKQDKNVFEEDNNRQKKCNDNHGE